MFLVATRTGWHDLAPHRADDMSLVSADGDQASMERQAPGI